MEFKELFMLCESEQNEQNIAKLDKDRYKANIKFDGERVMAIKDGSKIILANRRGNIITHKFREVVEALEKIEGSFIIDGEIIAMNDNFNLLQRRALTKDLSKIAELEKIIPVKYMVFDILFLGDFGDRKVLMTPLRERCKILRALFEDSEHMEMVEYDDINNLLSFVIENEREGIVIKDMNGIYEHKRSKLWLKHKLFKETTITITSFTDNPKGIRAEDTEGNAVQIAGHHADTIKAKMEQDGSALINVQYLTKSKDGRMRFPSFRGLAE